MPDQLETYKARIAQLEDELATVKAEVIAALAVGVATRALKHLCNVANWQWTHLLQAKASAIMTDSQVQVRSAEETLSQSGSVATAHMATRPHVGYGSGQRAGADGSSNLQDIERKHLEVTGAYANLQKESKQQQEHVQVLCQV